MKKQIQLSRSGILACVSLASAVTASTLSVWASADYDERMKNRDLTAVVVSNDNAVLIDVASYRITGSIANPDGWNIESKDGVIYHVPINDEVSVKFIECENSRDAAYEYTAGVLSDEGVITENGKTHIRTRA